MDIKKVLEMKAKREDARLKAMAVLNKAEAEDRFLSDDEQKEIDKYESEIRSWDESINRAEKMLSMQPEDRDMEKPEAKPSPSKGDEKRFSSFGEQLMAVYRAAAPGGRTDERLSTRAALGANETTPSDGGFLVQQDFVTELLKRTYETGILASKVKKIPISANANSLKINAVDEESRANGSRWGGIQTYWEGEAEELTASKPKFRQMELTLKKLTGLLCDGRTPAGCCGTRIGHSPGVCGRVRVQDRRLYPVRYRRGRTARHSEQRCGGHRCERQGSDRHHHREQSHHDVEQAVVEVEGKRCLVHQPGTRAVSVHAHGRRQARIYSCGRAFPETLRNAVRASRCPSGAVQCGGRGRRYHSCGCGTVPAHRQRWHESGKFHPCQIPV